MTRQHESAVSTTNSHSGSTVAADEMLWQPVRPPRRGEPRTAFHAQMLMPGFSLAFHAAALGRSRTSIMSYRAAAIEAARSDPRVLEAVDAAIWAMRPEHGLAMAQARGTAQLPYWSRLAICDYRKRGLSRPAIANAFRCSLGTVANVLQGKGSSYSLFSGVRCLTSAQRNPPRRMRRPAHRVAPSDRAA